MSDAEPKNVNLIIQRYEYRTVYAKTGRATFISHLDLMRAMQRAMKRAGLPVWHTQGFNPHVYIMFPLALPLGNESSVEIMDFALTQKLDFSEVKKRFNGVLPEGLEIISCKEPVHKHTEINSAEYEVQLISELEPKLLIEKLNEFLDRKEILIEKRTKKKTVNLTDIKPYINVMSSEICGKGIKVCMKLPAGGSFNLNCNVVVDEFQKYSEVEFSRICVKRTKIMTENGESFI